MKTRRRGADWLTIAAALAILVWALADVARDTDSSEALVFGIIALVVLVRESTASGRRARDEDDEGTPEWLAWLLFGFGVAVTVASAILLITGGRVSRVWDVVGIFGGLALARAMRDELRPYQPRGRA